MLPMYGRAHAACVGGEGGGRKLVTRASRVKRFNCNCIRIRQHPPDEAAAVHCALPPLVHALAAGRDYGRAGAHVGRDRYAGGPMGVYAPASKKKGGESKPLLTCMHTPTHTHTHGPVVAARPTHNPRRSHKLPIPADPFQLSGPQKKKAGIAGNSMRKGGSRRQRQREREAGSREQGWRGGLLGRAARLTNRSTPLPLFFCSRLSSCRRPWCGLAFVAWDPSPFAPPLHRVQRPAARDRPTEAGRSARARPGVGPRRGPVCRRPSRRVGWRVVVVRARN